MGREEPGRSKTTEPTSLQVASKLEMDEESGRQFFIVKFYLEESYFSITFKVKKSILYFAGDE